MADETLTDEYFEAAKERLRMRLDKERYEHSLSVSDTAVQLARAYGVDERKARLAGLLHDWDKGYSDKDITERAQELRVAANPVVLESMPRLLHGPTAAIELAREFPGIGEDVLQAIARHTSAEVGMTDLDMIVYTADAIEPLRPFDSMAAVRDSIGAVSLEELFLGTFQHVIAFLVEKKRRMHPDTVKVWNYYVERARSAPAPKLPGSKKNLRHAQGKEARDAHADR
ncbi:bis(5'-nucleosyl)-tetraphosphatase (symmetrical) YqeK [Raoultibacter phocaeensis]|uniref:bis(5'-nucleosyl)-tetraphosphatase (symmetrical) YqeK n=1 Tax=Raoultibacter phocaeensis TaxID=2479841 RepID=UPI00111A01CA|nr:bis(5'-nucleosyl)-tetraphosphatase (symmetrical) YqeK [Raoultibacter phocaeensis]